MSITVYWACDEEEWMRAKEPEPIYKNFLKNIQDKNTSINFCPSIKEYMKNIFSVKSIYEYNFEITDDQTNIFTNLYNQKFVDRHVVVRSNKEKLYSFTQNFIFCTEEKSLKMSTGISPFLEDNNITKRCMPIPGTMDIGKWFRLTDFAFYLKNDYNRFEIKEEEIFQYIEFHTKEKIIFKQFYINEKIRQYLMDVTNVKNSRINKNRALENYYALFNHKKQIIKEIKNNLIQGDKHG
jgi:hypothetical protein